MRVFLFFQRVLRMCVGSSSVFRCKYGQTRFQCQHDVLSSSPSTQMYPALARRWFGGDTRACLRHVARRLLQRSPRHGSENNHRQATTSVECCRTSRQWHQEVRPRSLATDAPGVTLAGYPWASQLLLLLLSLAHWLTGVCSAKRQCTCPTVVARLPKSQHIGICGLLHVISWPFRDIVSALTVVGHSLSLVRWRSTLCQIICETPLSAQQLSDSCWKLCLSARLAH